MKLIFSHTRCRVRMIAVCAAAALLAACASDPGEKVADAPFPNLAEVPPRPVPDTSPEEREALRKQLENRRDEINRAAASLLRGGTEPVPVALESQVPEAPETSRARTAPPPLPAGLPQPPARPEFLSDGETPPTVGKPPVNKVSDMDSDGMIQAPEEAQMPPARAAGEAETSGGPEAADDDIDDEIDNDG